MKLFQVLFVCLVLALVSSACGTSAKPDDPAFADTEAPEWFSMELTDVQTGETFTMNDFTGQVVLLETMAMWCPNCVVQAHEVEKLHEQLGYPEDLISISLDVDLNEDESSLKEYVEGYGYGWRFAVAPIPVARALGTLYSAQYLNPPLSPMLVIDRDGNVHQLEYGKKDANLLREIIEPFLKE